MDNDQAGDLTDIFRSGGAIPSVAADLPSTAAEWQLPPGPMLFLPLPSSSDGAMPSGDVFGYPFTGLQESFGSDYSSGAADGLEAAPDATDASTVNVGFDAAVCGGGGGSGGGVGGGMPDMRKPIFPRGLKMPAVSPRAIRPYPVMGADMVKLGGPVVGQAVGPCALDAVAGMQMPSPRAGGIKRRKNQARKVVCIPAPAAAAGAAGGGQVVRSCLLISGRGGNMDRSLSRALPTQGYYRCSSSKGCSARKQVERSRTDPNMLVITYTSEHNHPWPTQRNALAGSTRSHHANNNSSSNNNSASKNSSHNQKTNVKQEPKDRTTTAATTTPTTSTTTTTNTPPMVVKAEAMVGSEMEKFIDASVVVDHGELLHQVFSQSYKPMIPEAGHPDDFFADLAELEPDPTSLIFSKEYMEAKPSDGGHDQDKAIAKGLDPFPFNMLD